MKAHKAQRGEKKLAIQTALKNMPDATLQEVADRVQKDFGVSVTLPFVHYVKRGLVKPNRTSKVEQPEVATTMGNIERVKKALALFDNDPAKLQAALAEYTQLRLALAA